MKIRFILTTAFLKTALKVICRVDSRELSRIPSKGPLIICMNHVNFLEVPLIQVCVQPGKLRGLVKSETWDNRFMRYLLNTYRAIPIDRTGVNLGAFREIKKALDEGSFICIAPEGTRSGDGVLQQGKPGIAAIALMTGAPIVPVVHFGGERFWPNFRHFKRTRVTFRVGRPFVIESVESTDSEKRKEITEQIMLQMARLLPAGQRGVYSEERPGRNSLLRFLD